VGRLFPRTKNPAVAIFASSDTSGNARLIAVGAGTTTVSAALGRMHDDIVVTVAP
jgi:hypothetical protein